MSQPEDLSKVLTGAQDSHGEAPGNPGYSGSAQVPDNRGAKSDSENKPKQDPATTPKTVKDDDDDSDNEPVATGGAIRIVSNTILASDGKNWAEWICLIPSVLGSAPWAWEVASGELSGCRIRGS